jgi:hypothetical protein
MAWHIGFALGPNNWETGAMSAAAVAALLFDLGIDQKRAAGTDTQEQTAPQGKDAPGPDDNVQPPLAQEDGVIKTPPTGDEGIHTEVPNPNAGPRDEIAPPPQLPGAENAQPK